MIIWRSLQDMGFFDNPKNGPGALATRLAVDASAVQGVSFITSLMTKVAALAALQLYGIVDNI